MGIVRAQINRIAIWAKNQSRANGNTDLINLADRQAFTLEINKSEDVKDYRNRVANTYWNVKGSGTVFNIGHPLLATLLEHVKRFGCSAEFVGEKIANSVYQGVYAFENNNYLGLDFEYELSDKQRACKIDLEAKYEDAVMKAILQDSLTSYTNGYLTMPAQASDFANKRSPQMNIVLANGATLFTNDEWISRSLKLKTAGSKSGMNRTLVNYLDTTAEFELQKASASDLNALANMPWGPSLTIIETDPNGKTETHYFQEGVLSLVQNYTVGDQKRTTKLKFAAQVPISCVSVNVNNGSYVYTYSL